MAGGSSAAADNGESGSTSHRAQISAHCSCVTGPTATAAYRGPPVVLLLVLAPDGPADHDGKSRAAVDRPDGLKWKDGPPSLPLGARITVLEGDPVRPGPFVFRVKVPDCYRIPPHTHPKAERVTSVSGTFYLGIREKFDATNREALPAGTNGTRPPGMKHYVWVKGGTVVQFHGDGPRAIESVNPADDPRSARK